MPKEIDIYEEEFSDILSLQLEAHNHIQRKARNLISITVAAIVATTAVLSNDMMEISITPLTLSDSVVAFQSGIFSERQALLLGYSIGFFQHFSWFVGFFLISLSYWKIFDTYRRVQIHPVLSINKYSFQVKGASISSRSDKKRILNKNNTIIQESFEKYHTAMNIFYVSILFMLTGLILSASIVEGAFVAIAFFYSLAIILTLNAVVTVFLGNTSKGEGGEVSISSHYTPDLSPHTTLIVHFQIISVVLLFFLTAIAYMGVWGWIWVTGIL